MKILRDGRVEVSLFVPVDSADDALLMKNSIGLLLEAKIAPVTRKAP